MIRMIVLVVTAAALHVSMHLGWMLLDAKLDGHTGDVPFWYSLLQGAFVALPTVLPGVVLGYLAKLNGMLLGALCGLLAGPVEIWLVHAQMIGWGFALERPALLASAALGAALISAVAGGAGQLLAANGRWTAVRGQGR